MASPKRSPRIEAPYIRSAAPEPVRDDAAEAFTEALAPETKTAPRAPTPVPAAPLKKRNRWRRPLMFAGPVLVAIGALAFYLNGGRWATTDDAYVKADIVSVATDVSGTVASVVVRNDQHVAKGDLLFQLDDEPYRLAHDAAEADLHNAVNQIGGFKQLYHNQIAQVQTGKTDVAYYQLTNQRALDLVGRQAGTQATLDQARHDLQNAQSKVTAAQLQADAVLATLGGNPDLQIEDYPQYRKAKAQLEKTARDLRHAAVRAPADGVVTNVDSLRPGNFLAAGQPAFNLVASDHVWIEAHFKETDLTYVRPGNAADVAIDTYPGTAWKAQVDTISPATGSQFSVLPAQNSSGNWVKVVQRIPVRLKVEAPDGAPRLRAGMSVVVDIDTGHQRTLAGLGESMRHMVGL